MLLRSERPREGLHCQQRRPTHIPSIACLPAFPCSHGAWRSDPCTEAKPQPPLSWCQGLCEQGHPFQGTEPDETFLPVFSVGLLLWTAVDIQGCGTAQPGPGHMGAGSQPLAGTTLLLNAIGRVLHGDPVLQPAGLANGSFVLSFL